jgi:GTPase SAR1 family protein
MAQVFRYAQLVMGPAGSGKSTYCKILQEHFGAKGKTLRVLNLDPAAEKFSYRCDIDIRDFITVEDVMDELDLGPNGGLVFALE